MKKKRTLFRIGQLVGVNSVGQVLSLASVSVASAYLSIEFIGRYATIAAVGVILGTLLRAGQDSVAQKVVAISHSNCDTGRSETFITAALLIIVALFSILLFMLFVYSALVGHFRTELIAALIMGFILAVSGLYEISLRATGKVLSAQLVTNLMRQVIAFCTVLSLVLLALPSNTWSSPAAFALIPVSLMCLAIMITNWNYNKFRLRRPDTNSIWPQFSLGIPFAFAAVLFAARNQIDVLLMGAMLNQGDVGNFYLAQRFAAPLNMVLFAITAFFMPKYLVTRSEDKESIRFFQNKVFKEMILFCIVLAIGLLIISIVVSKYLIPLFFGSVVGNTFLILAAANAGNLAFGPVIQIALYESKSKLLPLLSLVPITLTLALTLLVRETYTVGLAAFISLASIFTLNACYLIFLLARRRGP